MNLLVSTLLLAFINIFHNKSLKISIWNRTIGYCIIQCILGFMVDNCVPMDTYMTRNPCANDMFPNRHKAFINFNYNVFLKWKGFEFYNSQLPKGKKRNRNKLWIYSHQKRQRTSKEDVLHYLLHWRSN